MTRSNYPTAIALVLAAFLAITTCNNAHAQGSTGGSLGNTGRSISGGEERRAPPSHKRAAKPARVRAAATSRYLGCFRDRGMPFSTSGRDLNGAYSRDSNLSTEACVARCRSQGFTYAGTQAGRECFCGNSYGSNGAASNCNSPCNGNPGATCGGRWANSVYRVR